MLPELQPPRSLAAHLIESQLLRLGRAGAIVERRLGQDLLRMTTGHLYRRLGFVRLADFLTERLGLRLRRCQVLLRIERLLAGNPRLARAHEAGALPVSKLELLAGVVTPQTEELWLARARRLTVRQLEAEARAARAADSLSSSSPSDADGISGTQPEILEPEDDGVLVSFPCPGGIVALWHWALDLIRRVAGQQEPAWRCPEYLAAEYLSGVPDAAGPAPGSPSSAPAGSASVPDEDAARRLAAAAWSPTATDDAHVWAQATSALRDALAPLGSAADPDSILSSGPAGDCDDPWDLDARLRGLVRLRQSLAWRQGRLLSVCRAHRLYQARGAESFEDWCREMLGMSPRRARYLVALDRRLATLPLLADAYRRGLISRCQARCLVRVVRPETQSRWIRYARQVTVRRLEAAVEACETETSLRGDEVSSRRGGPPLPPLEPAPGRPSAPPAHLDRHTSAPPPEAGCCFPHRARLTHRITFWAPADVADLWSSAVRACRQANGPGLRDWECLLAFVQTLRETWENPDDPGWRRRYRIFERDGWRCRAPGCTSRSRLNEHHIIPRARGGPDADDNLVTLCVGHHQHGVHRGSLRCVGRAPGEIFWDLGVRPDGPPLARYFGEKICGFARPGKAAAQTQRLAGPVRLFQMALDAAGPAWTSGR